MLQFITNSAIPTVVIDQAVAAMEGGCKWVQLRMKNVERDVVVATARELKPLCAQHECILIVDDLVDVAKELQLDGVHLGKNDMSPSQARFILGMGAIIGATANTFDDISRLATQDIDYIGLGPYKFTKTKSNLSPILGLDGYASIMTQCRKNKIFIPTVAIGGIEYGDIEGIMNTGVNGVAVSGAIIGASDPISETRRMISLLQKLVDKRLNK